MKSKKLIFIVLAFATSVIYSQKESSKIEIITSIASFEIFPENSYELKNFDWNGLLKTLKNGPPNDPISIGFEYNKDSNLADKHIDSFSFKVAGKSSEAQELVDKSKGLIREFISKS